METHKSNYFHLSLITVRWYAWGEIAPIIDSQSDKGKRRERVHVHLHNKKLKVVVGLIFHLWSIVQTSLPISYFQSKMVSIRFLPYCFVMFSFQMNRKLNMTDVLRLIRLVENQQRTEKLGPRLLMWLTFLFISMGFKLSRRWWCRSRKFQYSWSNIV